jgi:Kdo2-lipid IVA lauroyltransferase/acyltransferase
LIKVIAGLFARLPLRINHLLGSLLGRAAYALSPRLRRRMRENLALYFVSAGFTKASAQAALRRAAIRESGKGFTELSFAWMAPMQRVYAMVKSCTGWKHVEAALARKQGIIFVTPHLGCYDIAGRYLESRLPLLALYRSPKLKWLEPLMQAGRARGEGKTATAGTSGVRALLKTLKEGGNIMILPDQVPGQGDGVWVDFFGKPAYTMTLLARLQQSTHATVLFFFGERLPNGAGYHVHIEPMEQPLSASREIAARQTNEMVEKLVAMAPAQYLWGYNRYKHPAGAPLPPAAPSKEDAN